MRAKAPRPRLHQLTRLRLKNGVVRVLRDVSQCKGEYCAEGGNYFDSGTVTYKLVVVPHSESVRLHIRDWYFIQPTICISHINLVRSIKLRPTYIL